MSEVPPETASEKVARLIGADRVRKPLDREHACVGVMVEPASVEEISELVRMCETDRLTLAPVGAARTLSQMRHEPVTFGISLARLNRIVAHEPDDLTVAVEAGMTIAALNAELAKSHQRLPVDPFSPVETTVGALVAGAHSGPLRLSEGTPRDLLIGVGFVGQAGRTVHGGGRVVKNVAGYDLMKVIGGSFGTLGIITETVFKIRPIPEQYAVALIPHNRAEDAFAGAAALHDKLSLAHLEVLSPALADQFGHSGKFLIIAGFSGSPSEIGYQAEKILELAGDRGAILDAAAAEWNYETLRDLDFTARPLSARFSVLPAALPAALDSINGQYCAHPGNGIAEVYVAAQQSPDSAQKIVGEWRERAARARGHVRIIAAAEPVRSSFDYFDQPNDGALKLMRRLKQAFDPSGIFNPSSFVGGI
ncbi:MAG TPA: FAD-binding oxidoreductase [Candidatus Binataceae bacterium]|nr:FAD-binding oxidoreductase [Candidatus Binataceae bacterium]